MVRRARLRDLLRISDDILRVRHLVVVQIVLVMHNKIVTNGCGAMSLRIVGEPWKDISGPVDSRNTARRYPLFCGESTADDDLEVEVEVEVKVEVEVETGVIV